jgi:hypothetical protein
VADRAARRIRELAWPASIKIGELIASKNPMVALAAAKDVLDRNGFKAVERVQSDGRMVIEIELIDRAARGQHKVIELNGEVLDASDSAP